MTMPGDYSEELVELVARTLPIDYDDHTTVVEVHMGTGPEGPRIIWGDPRRTARAILDALSSAGRLVPEGSEVRARIAATAETLRVVAEWGFVPAEELHRVAQEVAAGDVADWTSCPVCEEIECDAGCPLAPVRSPSVPDTEEGS